MTQTFYSVLGVGPDADADAVERAYREAVKECHPDVSDRPDARDEFRRLTTARDVLTDESERTRYHRLGHVSYVRQHVDCSVWTAPDAEATERTRQEAATESGCVREAAREATARTTADGPAADTWTGSAGPRSGAVGSDAVRGSGGAAATATGRSSFWATQETGRRHGGETRSAVARLVSGALSVGPWLVVHAVLLALALWTAEHAYVWLLAHDVSAVLALCVAAGEVALAMALVGLHLLVSVAR
jgi:curved DNA-binding protein CbpA